MEQVRAAAGPTNQHHGTVVADVVSPEQVASAVDSLVQRVGVPDLVLNSAGIVYPGYLQDLDLDRCRKLIEVNYLGTLYVTRAVLPGMMRRRSGHIVNISSGAGFLGLTGYTAYCASKYAVRGFSEALRAELKPHGVHVSVVFPPDTDTPQLAGELPHRPAETQMVFGSVVMSADAVAAAILRGVARRRYVITPGLETTLAYWLIPVLGALQYPIVDFLMARARRRLKLEAPMSRSPEERRG